MRKLLRNSFIVCLLSLLTTLCGAQELYTRKAKMADFPVRTTKIVLQGSNSFLELVLKEELTARWRISPYEFCNPEDYSKLRSDNSYYFLYLAEQNGVALLVLEKGGKADDEDNLKRPFELIRIPISAAGRMSSGRELMFMGAFVDILQAFVEDAMISDQVAYSGLDYYNRRDLRGKTIYLDPDMADELYLEEKEGNVLGFSVSAAEAGKGKDCYKMLISADTHELLFFKKCNYRDQSDAEFSEAEARQFERRHGKVIR